MTTFVTRDHGPGTGPGTAVDTGTGPATDPLAGLDLPPPPELREASTADARALSRILFGRLAELEEGTYAYSYVRNTLVELNLALVRYAVSRFRLRSESREDVVQVGTVGLIKAINRYDLGEGTEFPTFALPTITGEIKRHFRDTSWAVRVPRRMQERRLTLAKASARLEQTLGRGPSVAELAEQTGLDPDEVVEGLVAANAYKTSSLDYHAADEEGESFLARRTGVTDPDLEKVENLVSLKPLVEALPERDRKVLDLRFGAEMTQSEIGTELGISQMHVSRLLSSILRRLREGLTEPA
ncbi:SigB/SigF/SigG family RNA polymerase sigma factor [Streptomyces sp. NBC_01808]|uniref:SigB/SigF/SigG family RNA polymerase sigma factor n=1 Tax=Streptomyces sp. NBC_01808 TaxID=2975947 RepID=UPI002DD86C46|nr:SigB/SigF/SigG family RNA polymerase sigma factor [Streptomyces sp. NBC_01808]WSA38840.1 SigB/SigF/SigG family RNA polymerase sigma factor [Streptomyces sp. NBC_01808]